MGLHAAIIWLSPLIQEGEQRWVASVTPLWKILATPLYICPASDHIIVLSFTALSDFLHSYRLHAFLINFSQSVFLTNEWNNFENSLVHFCAFLVVNTPVKWVLNKMRKYDFNNRNKINVKLKVITWKSNQWVPDIEKGIFQNEDNIHVSLFSLTVGSKKEQPLQLEIFRKKIIINNNYNNYNKWNHWCHQQHAQW